MSSNCTVAESPLITSLRSFWSGLGKVKNCRSAVRKASTNASKVIKLSAFIRNESLLEDSVNLPSVMVVNKFVMSLYVGTPYTVMGGTCSPLGGDCWLEFT